jgi:hypothetical protein
MTTRRVLFAMLAGAAAAPLVPPRPVIAWGGRIVINDPRTREVLLGCYADWRGVFPEPTT